MSARFETRRSGAEPHRRSAGRVLYLTNQSPFPPHSGGQMREWNLISRLAARYDIDLVAVTAKFERDVSSSGVLLEHCRSVAFFAAEPGTGDLPDRVLRHQAAGVGDHIAERLAAGSADVVHVEGYFLMQHVPDGTGVPVLLMAENIEYEVDRARQELLGAESVHWTRTRELEHAAWLRADLCGAITSEDAAVLQRDLPGLRSRRLPNGCDHLSEDDPAAVAATRSMMPPLPPGRTVAYVGTTMWEPSRDATLYLIRELWPKVLAEVPDATLLIAGDGQHTAGLGLESLDPSVFLLGQVPSLRPVLEAADVFACPVRFGGGVKAKILEALHAGCVVVSTTPGAQGLGPQVEQALLTGDTTDTLIFEIVRTLRDPRLRERQRTRVREAARTLPTWAQAAECLDSAWSCLRTSRPARLASEPRRSPTSPVPDSRPEDRYDHQMEEPSAR